MSRKYIGLGLILFSFLLLSCNQAPRGKFKDSSNFREKAGVSNPTGTAKGMVSSASKMNGLISSSAALSDSSDTRHVFIRSASLKFRVKDVISSTYSIESITKEQGGFVANSSLMTDIDRTNDVSISSDSLLEITYYTISNRFTLRVPVANMNATLQALRSNVDFLDYRDIVAQDISANILSNELANKRYAIYHTRVSRAVDSKGKKLEGITTAEDALLSEQEESDKNTVNTYQLQDEINFCTIQLFIYQRSSVRREVIADNNNVRAYEPSFGSKVVDSLSSGWHILLSVILFFVQIWGLLLLFAMVFVSFKLFKIYRKRKTNGS